MSVARSRTFREHQNKILLEGRRLICEALDAGALPQTVFFSHVDRLKELPLERLRRASLVKVKFEDIKTWSDVVAPQGVIGEGPNKGLGCDCLFLYKYHLYLTFVYSKNSNNKIKRWLFLYSF